MPAIARMARSYTATGYEKAGHLPGFFRSTSVISRSYR
jgi:hypothetical protein